MTYIITEPCIDLKDKSCIDVCPFDCIHETDRMLVIDPEECIDCGACEPECPTTAIFEESELPAKWNVYKDINSFISGAKKWVTADGIAAPDGSNDTYALVTNTDARAGLLKVTALFDDGTAPVEKLFAIGASQRFTIRGRTQFPEVVGKGYSFVPVNYSGLK